MLILQFFSFCVIYDIEVDSVAMECRLPCDKVLLIKSKLEVIMCRKKVPLRNLQSLIGLLSFACSVVVTWLGISEAGS